MPRAGSAPCRKSLTASCPISSASRRSSSVSGVATELASLYEMHPVVPPGPEVPESPSRADQEARAKEVEQTIQNVLLPAMRLFLQPPAARATDGSALLVTTLERLYRVFERC